MKHFRKIAIGAAGIAMVAAAPSQAVVFNFTYVAGTSSQAIAGFNQAAAIWSSSFTDDITVNLTVGTATLGSGVLFSSGFTRQLYGYTDVRNALNRDATSATDATAVAHLPTGSSFSVLMNDTTDNPNGAGGGGTAQGQIPFLDTAGANTQNIRITTANAKALGLTVSAASIAAGDGSITFASGYNYDFDPSNGIDANAYDFVGLATRELGKALGFISGVDILAGNQSGFSSNAFTYVSTLDLFRYSAQSAALNAIDFTVDNRNKYFSVDGGATMGALFSNGACSLSPNQGCDGNTAGSWRDAMGIGVFDPVAAAGEKLTLSANDLKAMDAIGWNLSASALSAVNGESAVPEPASWAMFIGGFGLIGGAMRRKPVKTKVRFV